MTSSSRHRSAARRTEGPQHSTFWIDESGSKGTANRCFVVAGIKTRHPDDLQRDIHALRERTGFDNEFKFGRLNATTYRVFLELIDVLDGSDAHLMATVVDAASNPFKGKPAWEAHAAVISKLLVGNINRNEVGVAFIDGISTPPGRSLGRAVKRSVNGALRSDSLVTAVSLNSKTNDLLQAADLVAGAVRHQRMAATPGGGTTSREKAQVAARLAVAFGVTDLTDQRTERVNIATLRNKPGARKPSLRMVRRTSAS